MKLPLHLLISTELKKNVFKLKLEIKVEMNIYSKGKKICNIQDIFLWNIFYHACKNI